MAGFTIVCNTCGNKINVYDEQKAKNDKISIYTTIKQYGTMIEHIEKYMWCENCDNSTEFID